MRRILLLCLLLHCLFCFGEERYRFRVYLKDKGDDVSSALKTPSSFLSDSALMRRAKYGIAVDQSDVPVYAPYIDSLKSVGFTPIVSSKWFNTVVVETVDSMKIGELKAVPFVDSVRFVWKGAPYVAPDLSKSNRYPSFYVPLEPLKDTYGYGLNQAKMINVPKLHAKGFDGKGVKVAILDAGFRNVNKIAAFDSTKIISTYNVLHPEVSVYDEDDHGLKVFSCLAANDTRMFVGTAPKADYYLIACEDVSSEYPIEEDYWVRAAEIADSIGVDVISSSLGYFEFDDKSLSPTREMLDGKTLLISQGASKAADKGIMILCSAGNEGSGVWNKITFPSDSKDVYTVGAVDDDKKRSSFSSFGFAEKGRSVKPDGAAMGGFSTVIGADGYIERASGTSFATPILAGAVVCLMQAFPYMSNKEIIELLHESSSNYKTPNPGIGYGIPDIFKAYKKQLKNGGLRNKSNP